MQLHSLEKDQTIFWAAARKLLRRWLRLVLYIWLATYRIMIDIDLDRMDRGCNLY